MKDQLFKTGATSIKPQHTVGLIGTMPKSGTWLNHYFFHFFQFMLAGKTAPAPQSPVTDAHSFNEIGLDTFFIAHCCFPGFDQYNGKYRERWDSLQFHIDGFDWPSKYLYEKRSIYHPEENPLAKYVYIYRNPLDQSVSHFRHAKNHIDPTITAHKDLNGNYCRDKNDAIILPENPAEFMISTNLESYLKQYLTWKLSHEIYQDRILLISYEELIRDSVRTITQILEHFGFLLESETHFRCFAKAIELSSKDNMQAMENRIGRPLAQDQTDPNERHIRDGRIGTWKAHFSKTHLDKIERKLQDFGLSLTDFEIEGGSPAHRETTTPSIGHPTATTGIAIPHPLEESI